MDRQALTQIIVGLGAVAFALQARSWTTSKLPSTKEFFSFQLKYLIVILIMKTADWMQGPYVYKLYADKGFTDNESARLFLAGFASSAFLGVLVGSLADKYGRKKGSILFAILYASACVSYHSNDYKILVLGRMCSGVATSLLFSVFEAWYKAEHEKKNFDGSLVSQTFSRQYFADSLLAIGAGIGASFLVELRGTPVAPFDASCFILIIGGILVFAWWGENTSGSETQKGVSMYEALKTVFREKEILLCGVVQSIFGGTMYIFVFMWTPSLPGCDPGLVFSCFMVAIMIGTGIFQELEKKGWTLVDIVGLVVCGAAIALAVPVYTKDIRYRLAAFILYEVCIGIWFPSYHTLRLKLVPDNGHATILSFFRFPLNLIVITNLLFAGKIKPEITFLICFYSLVLALLAVLGIRTILNRKVAGVVSAKAAAR